MSDDQFMKLFKYIEEFRGEVKERFDENSREHADSRGAVAELSAQVRDYHHEMVILPHQVDRMREAIKQIARETGVKLSVEL
jgi:uncharacterized coiled-coil DUF342 family protein